jgi:hypothetical protein
MTNNMLVMCEIRRISPLFSLKIEPFTTTHTHTPANQNIHLQSNIFFVMSISAAKLAILADYYGFDLDEAREYIGLPPTKNRGRPAPECGSPKVIVAPRVKHDKAERRCSLCSKPGHNKITCPSVGGNPAPKPAKPTKPDKQDKGDKPKRDLDGFNLYIKANKNKVSTEMKRKLPSGEKLLNKTLNSMLAYDWKSLDDVARRKWNRFAQAQA